MNDGDYEAAVGEFSKLTATITEVPVHWCDYGTALLRLKRTEQATDALEKALELARTPWKEGKIRPHLMVRIYNTLGQAKLQVGLFDQAEPLFREALKLNPRMAPVAVNLALVYERQGRLNEAIHLLRNSEGIESYPPSSRLLAKLLRRKQGFRSRR